MFDALLADRRLKRTALEKVEVCSILCVRCVVCVFCVCINVYGVLRLMHWAKGWSNNRKTQKAVLCSVSFIRVLCSMYVRVFFNVVFDVGLPITGWSNNHFQKGEGIDVCSCVIVCLFHCLTSS